MQPVQRSPNRVPHCHLHLFGHIGAIGNGPHEAADRPPLLAFPARIDVQVKVKDILPSGRFIGLREVDPVTSQSLFDGSGYPDRLLHHASPDVVGHGVDVRNVPFWDHQRMVLQREEDDDRSVSSMMYAGTCLPTIRQNTHSS